MMLCNYGWVYLSKSIALTFLFRNLFQDLSIRYCSALMSINYCRMLTLDTYCSVPMLCKVFTDAAHFNWNDFLNQCFLCYWQRWSSVYLDDKILSLVIVFGLTRRIIGQGSDEKVLSQLYMSAGHIWIIKKTSSVDSINIFVLWYWFLHADFKVYMHAVPDYKI
jgi:hypothetical protein